MSIPFQQHKIFDIFGRACLTFPPPSSSHLPSPLSPSLSPTTTLTFPPPPQSLTQHFSLLVCFFILHISDLVEGQLHSNHSFFLSQSLSIYLFQLRCFCQSFFLNLFSFMLFFSLLFFSPSLFVSCFFFSCFLSLSLSSVNLILSDSLPLLQFSHTIFLLFSLSLSQHHYSFFCHLNRLFLCLSTLFLYYLSLCMFLFYLFIFT